jgi:hypothetical protein
MGASTNLIPCHDIHHANPTTPINTLSYLYSSFTRPSPFPTSPNRPTTPCASACILRTPSPIASRNRRRAGSKAGLTCTCVFFLVVVGVGVTPCPPFSPKQTKPHTNTTHARTQHHHNDTHIYTHMCACMQFNQMLHVPRARGRKRPGRCPPPPPPAPETWPTTR